MKTSDSLYRTLPAIGTCLLLSLNATVLAQDTEATARQQTAGAGFDITITDGVLTHNGEQTDATLENVIDVLRDRHPNANIIVAPDVPRITVGNLKLRASNLEQELEALRIASGERFQWSGPPGPQVDLLNLSPDPAMPIQDHDQLLYVLRAAPEMGPGQLLVEAFSLGGYFASLAQSGDEKKNQMLIEEKIQELERMVNETVAIYRELDEEMHGRAASCKASVHMRFHRGANLVILIGDPRSIEIAAKVIGALPHVQRSGGPMGRYGELDRMYGGRGGGRFGPDPFPAGVGYGGAMEMPTPDAPGRR